MATLWHFLRWTVGQVLWDLFKLTAAAKTGAVLGAVSGLIGWVGEVPTQWVILLVIVGFTCGVVLVVAATVWRDRKLPGSQEYVIPFDPPLPRPGQETAKVWPALHRMVMEISTKSQGASSVAEMQNVKSDLIQWGTFVHRLLLRERPHFAIGFFEAIRSPGIIYSGTDSERLTQYVDHVAKKFVEIVEKLG